MDKIYTAQEMRARAQEFDEYLGNPSHYAISEVDEDARTLSAMLRQAADALEREEKREKKYEYGVKWLDEDGVRNNMGEHREWAEGFVRTVGKQTTRLIRREVGEWEEVKDGE